METGATARCDGLMHSWIAAITGTVGHHPAEALLVTFAAAVLEAVVIVGALVPGTAVMMAVAGVAAAAGLPKLPFVLAGAAGAVVGDTFSYWVGRHFGGHARGVWPLSRAPRVLARAEQFFRAFGGPSVAIARFVPGVRAAVPLVAGMAGMGWRSFLAADIPAALVWAPVHILPAQFAGTLATRLHAGDWRACVGLIAIVAALTALSYAVHRLVRRRTGVPSAAPNRAQSAESGSRRDAAAG